MRGWGQVGEKGVKGVSRRGTGGGTGRDEEKGGKKGESNGKGKKKKGEGKVVRGGSEDGEGAKGGGVAGRLSIFRSSGNDERKTHE